MRNRVTMSGTSWRKPRYQKDWRDICAILPAYLPDGTNGTVIHYADGSYETVKARLCWVLDDLLGYLRTSKQLLNQKSAQWLGNKNAFRLPLVVSNGFCLVPVKGRKSETRNHGNIGYVVLEQVVQVQACNGITEVRFAEQSISVLDRATTLQQNLYLGELLQQHRKTE